MGITEKFWRIWLFSANKIKSWEYFSKQPTQLIIKLNSSLQHIIVTEDAATCQKLCQNEPRCYFWTWATPDFFDVNYRKDCYLKAENVVMANEKGLISGPKNCGRGKVWREKILGISIKGMIERFCSMFG